MPEWPDLHVLRRRLAGALEGRRATAVHVSNPIIIRSVRPMADVLVERTLTGVAHRGKFLLFAWEGGVLLVINPMLAGLFALSEPKARRTRDTAFSIGFGPGPDLRYRDDKQMGKAYLLGSGEDPLKVVPGFAELGPEADPAALDPADLIARARKHRYEVRNLLLDQSFLAGIGNAYADEILFEARLHPKRKLTSLTADEWEGLVMAIQRVMLAGVEAVEAGLPADLGVKVRSHMRVRGRENEPCPRCGTRILLRSLGYLETNFCPKCQQAPAGQIY